MGNYTRKPSLGAHPAMKRAIVNAGAMDAKAPARTPSNNLYSGAQRYSGDGSKRHATVQAPQHIMPNHVDKVSRSWSENGGVGGINSGSGSGGLFKVARGFGK